ncbi:MAG: aerobic carbon-monoxide dehydrogenase large subunit, partial [Pseudolabrys sp.]
MNDMTPTSAERAEKLQGMGCKRKRVEDIRFVQGKGNYVDDIKLPGMLYGDFTRSPHAHARVKKIDTTKAAAVPGVVAVITAETLKTVNLAWMPTLAGDVQMVLADGKVLFQNQEVAFVIAEDRYTAADAAELVEVEYEGLPCNVDPLKAMSANAPVIREDIKDKKEGAHGPRKHPNHVFNWQAGDKAKADDAFAKADVTIKEMIVYPRVHPCPLETCQCVASFDKIKGELTLWGTFQAPHVIRTVGSLISKIPEHKIHVVAPDIGGGFGNKVGAYPGYICAIVASIVTGRPVKWVEDRIENLSTTAFARDFYMETEIAATKDGKVTGLRCYTVADHGAFDACANATKWPAGLFSIISGSYDFPAAHVSVDGVYTNKAPGGVAYRCSFRVTEAAYAIERAMDIMAQKLKMDPAEFRMKNLIRREQFPYTSAFGWVYDSGDYQTALNKAMETVGYKQLREEQKKCREAFKRGETRELMGIGLAFFTEIVGAGPSRNCDILGIAMFDSAEIRIHPTGTGICRLGTKSQGQGHETTYAQIIATELGLPADNIAVEEGNTDTAPYGLGTYGSRSTPVSGAATAMACRKIKAKAQMIAAYMLEVHDDDLEWDVDRFRVKGNPERFKTMTELAWAAYHEVPPGMEPGLEAINYYDPPNFTFPFGAYICVMDVDVDTGSTKVRRYYALDD